jgi:hypothetical protein
MFMYMGGDFDGFNPSSIKGLDINKGLFSSSRPGSEGTTSPPRAITPPALPAPMEVAPRLDPRNSQLVVWQESVARANLIAEGHNELVRRRVPRLSFVETLRISNG